jgi:nucleotide-binding universal stress UspA family protein
MAATEINPILIPYDFTSVSDIALDHAAHFAQLYEQPITILNIVDKSTNKFLEQHNKEEQLLNIDLENICKQTENKFHVKVNYLIKKGNINSIHDIAKELNISFMFIGIDQLHTLASKILQMISNFLAPVYVVQGNIEWKDIKTVVFPIDGTEDTLQKIFYTINIAKLTDSTVKLFSVNLTDKERRYIQSVRVNKIEKLLLENNIPFITDYATRIEKEFPNELIEYAKANNANLLILMKTPRLFFADMFINPIDKKVLLNSKNIPSLYITSGDAGR